MNRTILLGWWRWPDTPPDIARWGNSLHGLGIQPHEMRVALEAWSSDEPPTPADIAREIRKGRERPVVAEIIAATRAKIRGAA